MRHRPRRLRKTAALRALAQECHLSVCDLVMPLFVQEGRQKRSPVVSMPGIDRLSLDLLLAECEDLAKLGIRAIALFPVVSADLKNKEASEATNSGGLYSKALRAIKEAFPELLLISDVALDPYSSHGHDALLSPEGLVLNDATLKLLGRMAVCHVEAGADMVAPSDMMDGRIAYIRSALDHAGHVESGMIAYTAKYASAFYGPFRDALGSKSALQKSDKKSYQMNPANGREALWEARLDIREGADMLLVKPGLAYLDVLWRICKESPIPLAVYNVSGEYALLKTAAQAGHLDLDYKSCVMEILLSFKRAGADLIFSYHAKEAGAMVSERTKPCNLSACGLGRAEG